MTTCKAGDCVADMMREFYSSIRRAIVTSKNKMTVCDILTALDLVKHSIQDEVLHGEAEASKAE